MPNLGIDYFCLKIHIISIRKIILIFFLRWKFGRTVKSSFERQRPDFRKSSKEMLQELQSGSRIVQRQMLLELELTVQKMFIVIVI